MKLVICTKFQVKWMNCVESRGGGGVQSDPLPPPKASCSYFFFVNVSNQDLRASQHENSDLLIFAYVTNMMQISVYTCTNPVNATFAIRHEQICHLPFSMFSIGIKTYCIKFATWVVKNP